AIATALNAHTRASDVVGRFGGDEFVMLLWNATESQVRAKAQAHEAMIASLQVPFADLVLHAGATAGVALLGADDPTSSVCERAEADMSAQKIAKTRGIRSLRRRPRASAERLRA